MDENVPLEILEYDANWPELFAREERRLSDELGSLALFIDHIGSTAVPGLAAKPVIDIQIRIAEESDSNLAIQQLASLGYTYATIPLPYFHRPRFWPHLYHVHVRLDGSERAGATIAFRDRLRASPHICRDYEILKRGLAKGADADTREGRARYSNAKTEFIRSVLAGAELTP